MTLSGRRVRNVAIAGSLAVVLILLDRDYAISLRNASFLTGWILFGGVILLTFYSLRKALPFLPLIASSIWLQVHLYVGLCAALVFLLHAHLSWPKGIFDTVLWACFVLVTLSGLVGVGLSRGLPPRLGRRGERMILEQIAGYRTQLARRAESLVMDSATESVSTTLVEFYLRQVEPFLCRPRNILHHLVESNRPLYRLQLELEHVKTYLDRKGQRRLDELADIVAAKDALDYQFSLQLILKAWLFVHVPLTYTLLALIAVHLVLVYGFSLAAP